MIDNDEKKRIINLIAKLKVRTTANGCTEAEAIQAAEKLHSLLTEYNLTLEEADVAGAKMMQLDIDTEGERSVIEDVIMAIAYYTDTKIWRRLDVKMTRGKYKQITAGYTIIGVEEDVMVCEYIWDLLAVCFRREIYAFKANTINPTRAEVNGFKWGLASRINSRLYEMKKKTEEENSQNVYGLVLRSKALRIQNKLKEMGVNLSSDSKARKETIDMKSYRQGEEAANKIMLSKGVNNNEQTKLLK